MEQQSYQRTGEAAESYQIIRVGDGARGAAERGQDEQQGGGGGLGQEEQQRCLKSNRST
jgi:hypothetical protein